MRISVVAALCLSTQLAHAQGADRTYADAPTEGLALPTAPLAGEFDGRVVATNAGGLPLVRGAELALVLGLEDPDVSTSTGQGVGAYMAYAGGGGLLPRFGLGLGFEWLRPASTHLAPDPGEPFRFTLGVATALGKNAGFGASWHHFHDEGALSGVDTFELGLSGRWGNYLAYGATLRDLATGPIGGVLVQRRYEAEVLARPLGRDVLEVALGGRLGERRYDVDGWARLSARIVSGIDVHAAIESRETYAFIDSPTGRSEDNGRELRGTIGIEVSFGSFGVTTLASGIRTDQAKNHLLGGQLVLRSGAVPTRSIFGTSDHIERVELSGTIGLRQLTSQVARLRAMARDDSVKAVVVTFDGIAGGWATLQELRDELLAVRAAGKKVYAYMVSGTGRDYFVASVANKIYIDPAGGIRLVGLAGTTIFFKGAFDKVGVEPQFEKIAEYKSAPEQFTETGPSPTAAKMNNELFDSLWEQFLSQVADARKLTKDELRALVDNGPYTAGDLALNTKLVDAVAAPDKVSQLVMADIGQAIGVGARVVERPDRWKRPAIAIIYVDGDITDGQSRSIPFVGQSLAGGETLVAAIAAARANPDIGAIVLRIDSPGGSALASELVSREVFATRGVKPILCSFSDLAASGGYFIAAGCDVIYAKPMTITGSIGIFYGKFDLSGLLKKTGITTDTYKRGKRADVESLYRPYTAEERTMLMDKLKYMYGRFVGAVAEGRGMKKDEVDNVGRGHVWSGAMAKDIKLVDKFGGLGDAIDEAKRRLGLGTDERVQLVELPNLPSGIFGALGKLVGLEANPPAQAQVTDLPLIRQVLQGVPSSLLVDPSKPQARLPYDFNWSP
jgi:protease-4